MVQKWYWKYYDRENKGRTSYEWEAVTGVIIRWSYPVYLDAQLRQILSKLKFGHVKYVPLELLSPF